MLYEMLYKKERLLIEKIIGQYFPKFSGFDGFVYWLGQRVDQLTVHKLSAVHHRYDTAL